MHLLRQFFGNHQSKPGPADTGGVTVFLLVKRFENFPLKIFVHTPSGIGDRYLQCAGFI